MKILYIKIYHIYHIIQSHFSSVQFSRSVVSDSLQTHESQHARPPCPSPTPRVHSDSCPSSRWCHPAISSSVVPLSSCPKSLSASGLFQWVNSLALSLLYGPIFTSIHNYWKNHNSATFSSFHFSHSVVSDSCDPVNRNMPGLPVHHQLLEFTQTHVHRVGDAIQPSHPLSSPSLLPPIPPSIRLFSNESTLRMRWPKYWSFSFSISHSKEHPGLISFRMDWLDLLAVQGTLKSLLQHHSSKVSILRHSAFFTVQL